MKLSKILFEQERDLQSTIDIIVNDMIEPEKAELTDYLPDEEEIDLNPDEEEAEIQILEHVTNPTKKTRGKKPTPDQETLFKQFLSNSGNAFIPMNYGRLTKRNDYHFFRVKPNESIILSDHLKGNESIDQIKEKLKIASLAALNHSLQGSEYSLIKPKEQGSGSNRYNTLVLQKTINEGQPPIVIRIVMAAGEMRGHKYEKEFVKNLQMRGGNEWNQLQNFFKKNKVFVKGRRIVDLNNEIAPNGINLVGRKKVQREFTSEIKDIGQKISDVTLTLKDRSEIYISLKDKRGATFSNSGYSGAFILDKEEKKKKNYVVVPFDSDDNKELDKFILALGVNKNKIAENLTAYMNIAVYKKPNIATKQKEEVNVEPETVQSNKDLVKRYLAAQIGYGYIYFRELDGQPIIRFLKDASDAEAMVGNIQSIKIRYPYHGGEGKKSSKQCSVYIQTDYGLYIVEIRSTGGKVIAGMQCNIRLLRHNKIQTENKTLKNNLYNFLF